RLSLAVCSSGFAHRPARGRLPDFHRPVLETRWLFWRRHRLRAQIVHWPRFARPARDPDSIRPRPPRPPPFYQPKLPATTLRLPYHVAEIQRGHRIAHGTDRSLPVPRPIGGRYVRSALRHHLVDG